MWVRALAELARGLSDLLFPNTCLLCESAGAGTTEFRHGLCVNCLHVITEDSHQTCPRCASTVGPHTDVSAGCSACRDFSLGFDSVLRLGPYDGRLRDAVLRMKHASGESLAEMLGRIVADKHVAAIKAVGIGAVVPIPLHRRRRWMRGYNQAEAIACEIASQLNLQLLPRCLQRVTTTVQHAQPSATARRESIRGAFRHNRSASVANKAVLLVDDVLTTGSTASEAARVLKQAGATKVVLAVLARA